MMDYLQINYESLYVSNYENIFLTYNYILMNIHNSINSNRIEQYNNSNKPLTQGRRLSESKDIVENNVLPYTNLTFSEENKYLESALESTANALILKEETFNNIKDLKGKTAVIYNNPKEAFIKLLYFLFDIILVCRLNLVRILSHLISPLLFHARMVHHLCN